MEAAAWADKLQKETGFNYEFFKVLSLCRKPKETGSFPSITSEVKKVIMNIWFNEDFARNKGTREMLYDKLQVIADVNHWKIPSYQTVVRYIQFLMENKRLKNAHFLAERGVREYRNKKVVKAKRDTKGLQVMEVLMGDEHTFDCWVSYRQPNGKVIAIRPKLVAWIDVRSRMIMGDVYKRQILHWVVHWPALWFLHCLPYWNWIVFTAAILMYLRIPLFLLLQQKYAGLWHC